MRTRLATMLLFLVTPLPVLAGPISLWQFSSATATIFLLGSIHSMKPDMYPLPAPVEQAYLQADVVVFEVDLTRVNSAAMSRLVQRNGFYSDSTSIEQYLQPPTMSLLQQYFNQNNIGAAQLYRMKPWLLTLTIGQQELARLGYRNDLGIDQRLQQRAMADGKELRQLETIEEQIAVLSGDSPEVQDLSLRAALEDIASMPDDLEILISAWRNGDADRMLALTLESTERYPLLKQQLDNLIDRRNEKMIRKITGFAEESGTFLVVIGALHMGGERGVIDMLERDFELTQLSEEG